MDEKPCSHVQGSIRFRATICYAEQGPARAIKTADWEYISIRYTVVVAFSRKPSRSSIQNFPRLERWNFGAKDFHPGTFSADQLYHLGYDVDSQKELGRGFRLCRAT